MIQDTSAIAYYSMLQTLSGRQIEVYEKLKEGEMTNLELARSLGRDINVVTPRTNELVKKGIVEEGERRECNITGRKAIAWRLKHN